MRFAACFIAVGQTNVMVSPPEIRERATDHNLNHVVNSIFC